MTVKIILVTGVRECSIQDSASNFVELSAEKTIGSEEPKK